MKINESDKLDKKNPTKIVPVQVRTQAYARTHVRTVVWKTKQCVFLCDDCIVREVHLYIRSIVHFIQVCQTIFGDTFSVLLIPI